MSVRRIEGLLAGPADMAESVPETNRASQAGAVASAAQRASYNPLDLIDPASDDAYDNARLIASMLVVPEPGQHEPFWDEEAASLLAGIILPSSRHGCRGDLHLRGLAARRRALDLHPAGQRGAAGKLEGAQVRPRSGRDIDAPQVPGREAFRPQAQVEQPRRQLALPAVVVERAADEVPLSVELGVGTSWYDAKA